PRSRSCFRSRCGAGACSRTGGWTVCACGSRCGSAGGCSRAGSSRGSPAPPPGPRPPGRAAGSAAARCACPRGVPAGPRAGMPRLVIAIILGLSAFLVIVTACGFGFRAPDDEVDEAAAEEEAEDDEEGVIAIALGWLGHQVLSFKASLVRGIKALFSYRRA